MAPIRRYLRITPHTALEARIYLDNPGDSAWLLRPDDPSSTSTPLSRIVKAVQPLVLPKLREENSRTRSGTARGKKTKGVKDTVSGDDFEASVFLVESGSRHAILVRQRDVKPKGGGEERKKWDFGEWKEGPVEIREEDSDGEENLANYPPVSTSTTTKKRRRDGEVIDISDDEGYEHNQNSLGDSPKDSPHQEPSLSKADAQTDDKKKLSLATTYDGFSIYGRILCLIVRRRASASRALGSIATQSAEDVAGQERSRAMLENWVGTQAARDVGAGEVD